MKILFRKPTFKDVQKGKVFYINPALVALVLALALGTMIVNNNSHSSMIADYID